MGVFEKIFGTRSQREIKKIQPTVDKILALEDDYKALSEEALKAKTAEFKNRLDQGETLDDLLPEAFAAVREAADRVLGMRPYPVQLVGGIVLHQGRIAEMKTGEGKTLVAILPCYLNALTGKGVHVVTVNEYLAKRDSEWMGKVYRYMGLTVGLVIPGMSPAERRVAYAADITYCTNNELGFDYLRDNMAIYKSELVQRGHAFAIVDEVDSILIDEARTPLIISGKGEDSSKLYEMADHFVSTLRKQVFAKTDEKEIHDDYDCDYIVDEKQRTVSLTASGIAKAEKFFGVENLADAENATLSHHINQAMKARGLMKRDIDYVIKDGQVIIVDEFTGRLMYGRRYNEGLHQAIEAKEGVTVAGESKTLATITFQNFFRLYGKLSGMTGTALTEEEEFSAIYNLDVVEIPTNRPVIRIDHPDVVYKTEAGKFRAIIRQVMACHEKGQPVLVGTISIEKSEILSKLLKREGIPHSVLNAKHHEQEAQIVAQAGKLGAVTIATNMAGRGTDIKLTPEVKAAGGLAIIGTERHESRRVDRQLRGRAGRQGDPGSSLFFVSLEDNLMRLFGSERIAKLMDRMGLKEGEVIQAGMMSRAIERAQRKVEENNFGIRKRLLEYDDVMNAQREVIYTQRRHALYGERIEVDLNNIMMDYAQSFVDTYSEDDFEDFKFNMIRQVAVQPSFDEATYKSASKEMLTGMVVKDFQDAYMRRIGSVAATAYPVIKRVYEEQGDKYENIYIPVSDGFRGYNVPVNLKKAYDSQCKEVFKSFSTIVVLTTIDENWKEHLREMDELRQSVQNATYEQKDPLLIYKFESFNLFSKMLEKVNREILSTLFKAFIPVRENPEAAAPQQPVAPPKTDMSRMQTSRMEAAAAAGQGDKSKPAPIHVEKKVGRNDPCPCGSGKKYKHCHGQNE